MTRTKRTALALLTVFISSQATSLIWAQDAAPAAADAPDKPPLTAQELEQLIAPVALYPDALLTQILMASTYPLEIVQANRWLKANHALKADVMATELEKQPWDASVKSLVNFPDVLGLMSDKLDLTVKLGDAFIDQQADVMNTVQVLRSKAQASGNLKTNDQQKVTVEAAPPPVPATQPVVIVQAPPPQIITIQSASPTVIYVPTYNPTVVYGAWPYPAYPPYPYYPPRPPGYVATAAISFGIGVACGAAWGYAWGNSNWGRGDVNINVNQNANFNNNINRNVNNGNINTGNINRGNGNGSWQHNPAHRQGVPYDNKAAARKYGGAGSAQTTQAREAFRGRADSGTLDSPKGGAANRPSTGNPGAAANRPNTANPGGAGAANRPSTGNPGGGAANRPSAGNTGGGAANRPAPKPAARSTTGTSGNAFSGVSGSGGSTRSASQRGGAPAAAAGAGGGGAGGGGGGPPVIGQECD